MSASFIIPSRLQPGDKVAIVSPSAACAYLFPQVYELGIRRLQTIFNLIPIELPTTRKSPEYLSRNPEARADDINTAFEDASIKAIIATTGGSDCIRILPYLDRKIILAHPKIFLGYSDITNIHVLLWNLGLISYYGGALMSQFGMQGAMHDYTINSIKKALFDTEVGYINKPAEYTDYDFDWSDTSKLFIKRPMERTPNWEWYNCDDSVLSGRLWGGCLEVLDLQLAVNSPYYLPQFEKHDDIVLYIETSEELPSSGFIYRFVAALAERNILRRLKAILVGLPKTQFMHMLPPEGRGHYVTNQREAIQQALQDYNANLPVVFNLNFGHTDPQIVVPNGGLVHINCKDKTIAITY